MSRVAVPVGSPSRPQHNVFLLMPAYIRHTLTDFVPTDRQTLVGQLQICHAQDGYATQFAQQTKAWAEAVPLLQAGLASLLAQVPGSATWTLLLEYPLYRLRRRLDAVILTHGLIVVLEIKVGERLFRSEDQRQVEESGLD